MKATADLVQLAQLATEHSRALMAVMGPIGAQGDEHLTAISLASAGRHMLDASVWFSGFRDHLASRERTSAELLDQILHLVEVMQEKAQEFHRRFHELAAARSFETDELGRLASMVSESASLLYATLEALRWSVLECQADADIEEGRTHRFQNAEEAISFLRAQRH